MADVSAALPTIPDSLTQEDPKSLEDLISLAFCDSVFPEGTSARFIPNGHIERLITRDAVIFEFFRDKTHQASDEDDELINYVIESARKLLTISIISGYNAIDLKDKMKQFKVDDFDDECLPLRGTIDQYPQCFRSWSHLRKGNFKKEQWTLLAPVFPRRFKRFNLEPEQILPFTHVAPQTPKEGSFGLVYKVKIHSDHQEEPMRMIDGSLACAAIKDLKPSARGDEKWEAEWKTEADALEKTTDLDHEHIISVRAIITKGKLKYFVFQWADGGNLGELLESEQPILTRSFVREITLQLAGLAEAIRELHNYQGQESIRHGDLKPENILIFTNETQVGIWKVADMGLAKHHVVHTALRGPTSTRHATPSYEAPEAKTDKSNGRSRLYDIWSMGCVTLELIIWLLYGARKLDEFNRRMATHDDHPGPYYEYHQDTAKVHPRVTKFMDEIRMDPKCQESPAIRDLLEIVSTKLLIVPLPLNRASFNMSNSNLGPHAALTDLSSTSSPRRIPPVSTEPVMLARQRAQPVRATADDFLTAVLEVQKKGDSNNSYWFKGSQSSAKGVPSSTIVGPSSAMQLVIRPPTPTASDAGAAARIPSSERKNLQTHLIAPQELDHLWEYPIDNDFPKNLFGSPSLWSEAMPEPLKPATLCESCKRLDLWKDDFEIHDDLSEVEARAKACEFCSIRWKLCETVDRAYGNKVHFDKKQSHLRLNAGTPPILTIHCGPFLGAKSGSADRSVQVGLPQLPQAGGSTSIRILKEWLTDCDMNHKKCVVGATKRLPTRLIYVGTRDNPSLSVYETRDRDSMKYFALSHPWGSPPHFCTYSSNIAAHKLGISSNDLPLTFLHAVTITRDLGLEYLWIDSICIIQGPDGDFKQEARRMEDVFSNAYAVLAASSALGQNDGFLKKKSRRQTIMIPQGQRPSVFVCDFIDDFNKHVLESNLSRRGWVLQERALARRTIYFTEHQTYWECGDGVRSETMTRMQNTLASFLGDPNFPSVAIGSTIGGRIKLHQDMCMQYSRLALSRPTDRAVAIAGLEKRLVQSFGISGGFGVLYDDNNAGLLRRSMLWHRASDCDTMTKIRFEGTAPPTWSWMSYEGQIQYLDLPFRQVSWREQDVQPPWTDSRAARWYSIDDSRDSIALSVLVRDVDLSSSLTAEKSRIIMDVDHGTGAHKASKCVVLGSRGVGSPQKGGDGGSTSAVLLVTEDTSEDTSGKRVFHRVGVASVPADWVDISTSVEGLLM